MTLTVTADGSSLGNPGPAGWAWYVNDDCWAVGSWESSTDSYGKFIAVPKLLRATEAAGPADGEFLIQCDSQYITGSLAKWRHGWKKHGWCKADDKPIPNSDLVKDLDTALTGRTVRSERVRGHIDHPMNGTAGSRARGAAAAFQQGRLVPTGPGWTRDGRASGNREAQQVPSATSSSIPAAPQTDILF